MFVYGLYCPVTGELRYIGQTTKPIEKRLGQHLEKYQLLKRTHKNHWINKLLAQGLKPIISTLQTLNNREDLDKAEFYWIRFFKEQGCDLTNRRDGGIGTNNFTPEVRKKLSDAAKERAKTRVSYLKGKHLPEATKEKLRQANLGKKASLESRAKMSAAGKGKPKHFSPEGTEARRLAKANWVPTLQQRENYRQGALKRHEKQRQAAALKKKEQEGI